MNIAMDTARKALRKLALLTVFPFLSVKGFLNKEFPHATCNYIHATKREMEVIMDNDISKKYDYFVGRARELGAEKARLISVDTISVGEWIRWKCRYGCQHYGEDTFQPHVPPPWSKPKNFLKNTARPF